MISVAMLGPVEVHRDGEPVVVPSGKTTELLMRLALAAGTMVRTERLIEDLWADAAVATGRNTLQSKVSQLRRAFGEPRLVVGGPAGYTLAIDTTAVDALEVARLADEATAFREAGDAAAAARTCSVALAMFRGESLFDSSDADWLAPHRVQLTGLRLRLIEDQLGARMDLGATGQVVGELEELVAAYPLREGLAALLITALYRDGRQADALAAYRTVREQLAEELGLDPGPDLRKLEQQVLLQDPLLDAPAREPSRTLNPSSGGNLPALSSSIIGRDREVAELRELIAEHRLVTLVGPAGVGKTRLAIEVARGSSPDDGAWLVRLESARTAESVSETVAEALQANGASRSSLVERLRGTGALVVLDNCEHVIDAVADLAAPLLSAGPRVNVLATSQLPLGIEGEWVYSLQPLAFDDSVALFAERSAEHGKTFAVDSDAAATLNDVCQALDGLPLAIELAAARTKSLSIQEISRRLDDRFSLLSDPTSRRPARRRTLSAAIAWSYDLLLPDDQRGLWALACFVSGATLDAVEHVVVALGVPPDAVVDVVGRLVDRSLVALEVAADGAVRYRLLDSVRTFALDRMNEAGATHGAMRAYVAWFATCAASAASGVQGSGQAGHATLVRIERANIDAALRWASSHDPLTGLRIASDLGWVWVVLGDGLGAPRLRAALTAADAIVPANERVSALLSLGWLEASAGDVEHGHAAVAEALELLEPGADGYLRAKAEWYLAYVLAQQGRFAESLSLLERSRRVFQEIGSAWEEAANWVLTAHSAIASGDSTAAESACREAARQLDHIGDPWLLVHVEAMLGAVAQAEHRFADACEHLSRAAEESQQLGFAGTEAYHLANLGRAQQQAGDLDTAACTLYRAVEAARATGDLRVASLARVRLGRVLRDQGQRDAALSILQVAQDWYHASGGGDGARLADCLAASMGAQSGRGDAATRLQSVLVDARRVGDTEVEVLALDALARISADAGDTAAAVELLATADALMPSAQHHLTAADRVDADQAHRLIG